MMLLHSLPIFSSDGTLYLRERQRMTDRIDEKNNYRNNILVLRRGLIGRLLARQRELRVERVR